MTPGLRNHYKRLVADVQWHECEGCQFGIGKYPGRYPRFCPSCGADMSQQPSYPRRPAVEPDGAMDKPVIDVPAGGVQTSDILKELDEACFAVHALSGFPLVSWSPNKRFVALAAVTEGVYTFAIYAPIKEASNRVAGAIRFDSKNLTLNALFRESIQQLDTYLDTLPEATFLDPVGPLTEGFWPAVKARELFRALVKIGWQAIRQVGSHITMTRQGWQPFVFGFHPGVEIGPPMVAKVARQTGLTPDVLRESIPPTSFVPGPTAPTQASMGYPAMPSAGGTKLEDEEAEGVAKTVALTKDNEVGQIDQKIDNPPYTAQNETLSGEWEDMFLRSVLESLFPKYSAKFFTPAASDSLDEALKEFASHLHATKAHELRNGDFIMGFTDAKGYHHYGEHIVAEVEKLSNGDIRVKDFKGKSFVFPPNHEFQDVSFGPNHPEPKQETMGSIDGPADATAEPPPGNSTGIGGATWNIQPKEAEKEENYVDDQSVTPPSVAATGNSQGSGPMRERLEHLPTDADWYSPDGGYSRIWMFSPTTGTSFFWYTSGQVKRQNYPMGKMPPGDQLSASHPKVRDVIKRFFNIDEGWENAVRDSILNRTDSPFFQEEEDEVKDGPGRFFNEDELRAAARSPAGQELMKKMKEAVEPADPQKLKDKFKDNGRLHYKHAVAVVIKNKHEVLLGVCEHDDERKDKLCFPGGHVSLKHDGGDVQKAAAREAKEETNVVCTPTGTVLIDDEKAKHAFVVCEYVSGDLKPNWEFSRLLWVPFEKLDSLPNLFAPNRAILKRIPNGQLGPA